MKPRPTPLNKFVAIAVLALACSVGSISPAYSQAADAASTPAAVSPAPVTPSATPLAAASTKETVDNPYGLSALWEGGDFIARGTLIILVLMSMGSWYILITKLYESFKISGEAKVARRGFFKSLT